MILLILAIVTVEIHVVTGGECCKGYYDVLGDWQGPQWCDNYCCGTSHFLQCCDNEFLQAPSYDRSDFCELWWKNHAWAPVLTAIVSLGILIGCCVCCYKCCCASKHSTVVVQSPGTGMGTAVISNTVVSAQHNVSNSYGQPGRY